ALGRFPTPIEVVPYAGPWVRRELAALAPGVQIAERQRDGAAYRTDNGNLIFDCRFGSIADPAAFEPELRAIHGVVGVGIFVGLAHAVLVSDGSTVRELPRHGG